MAMGGAIVVLFFLPWIDTNPIRSIRYRSLAYKVLLFTFVIAFVILGYLGLQSPTPMGTLLARICSLMYFGFFIGLYFVSKYESTKPLPERVTH
jgi:ubiquinol-cytochrome c reductase cytochrome b subunit